MEFVEARERYPLPATYAWCTAIRESLASWGEFPTLSPIAGDVLRMRMALDMSKLGFAFFAVGVVLMALGFSDGTFVAGTGCLLIAIAGIRMRLIDRRRSRSINWQ